MDDVLIKITKIHKSDETLDGLEILLSDNLSGARQEFFSDAASLRVILASNVFDCG